MSELRTDDQTATPVATPWTAKLAAACGVICAIALVFVGAVAVLLAAWGEQTRNEPEVWIGASVLAVVYSAMMFAAALMIHRRITTLLQCMVLLMAPAAYTILLVTMIWNDSLSWRVLDVLFGIAACLTIVQFAILLTGGLALLRSSSAFVRLSRVASWGCLWITTCGVVLLIIDGSITPMIPWPALSGLLEVIAGFGVPLTFLSLAVTYIANRVHSNRRPESETLLRNFVVSLDCPRCETEVKLRPGESLCPGCRILMRLQVDEPKCECGYQLYKLQGDNCPECGRAIRDDQRWPRPDPAEPVASTAETSETTPAPDHGSDEENSPAEEAERA